MVHTRGEEGAFGTGLWKKSFAVIVMGYVGFGVVDGTKVPYWYDRWCVQGCISKFLTLQMMEMRLWRLD